MLMDSYTTLCSQTKIRVWLPLRFIILSLQVGFSHTGKCRQFTSLRVYVYINFVYIRIMYLQSIAIIF